MCYFHESPRKDGRTRMCVCVCSCLRLSCKSQRKPFSVNHCQLLWQWHTARLWYNHRWMTFHTSVYNFTCVVVRVCYFMCYHLFISGSLLLWKLYIQDCRILRVCSWVCVCSCVFRQHFVVVCAWCVCALLAQKASFLIRPSAPTNHFHLYFLFFSIYQLFTELKPLSPRYGGDLALFSSYSSYVTSASISNIPSTDALVCFSTHCKCMCTLDCSHLPGPGWTQAMTHTSASNGSEDLERLT